MNPPKERNIPASTSPLAPPKLTPKTGPLRVGGRGGDQDQAPEEEHDQDHGQEHEHPTAQPPRPGRTRGGRRPPPAAADAIPTTIRFDPEESAEVDQFVLELRVTAQRRNLDKAEVFREVLRLAREHEPTRRALLRRLR
ncbi:hypothetical protein ACH4C6_34485 [Streptomyces sp. NPDC017943]|uniref:hypothetical protein n=1 Tax=Streptomyces sp. NPDC017943 TaxID=3365019 RepID=UPI0037A0067E